MKEIKVEIKIDNLDEVKQILSDIENQIDRINEKTSRIKPNPVTINIHSSCPSNIDAIGKEVVSKMKTYGITC